MQQTAVPTKIIKNIHVHWNGVVEQMSCPVSTYETTLFASIQRGANVSLKHHISVEILGDNITRSVLFKLNDIHNVKCFIDYLKKNVSNLKQNMQYEINKISNHCVLLDYTSHVVGNLVYLRLSYYTYDASGHNISTIASNIIAKRLAEICRKQDIRIEYVSNSGNVCVDKKVSAINSILGRGKHVITEMRISRQSCKEILKTIPEKIVELNIDKNLIGSIVSGGVCSANAHYANMLAAVFLPFGQDVANIVEGSQGITYCSMEQDCLYISVNLPNVICGCVGNGKNIDFVRENLRMIGCLDEKNELVDGASNRLAGIIGAIVMCGELSLLAALTNQDELVKSHILFERTITK